MISIQVLLYTETLITAKGVIPAKAGIQTPSLRRQGTIILEPWIPPYQVRGRLSQARNDNLYKTYVVVYNFLCIEYRPEHYQYYAIDKGKASQLRVGGSRSEVLADRRENIKKDGPRSSHRYQHFLLLPRYYLGLIVLMK